MHFYCCVRLQMLNEVTPFVHLFFSPCQYDFSFIHFFFVSRSTRTKVHSTAVSSTRRVSSALLLALLFRTFLSLSLRHCVQLSECELSKVRRRRRRKKRKELNVLFTVHSSAPLNFEFTFTHTAISPTNKLYTRAL